MLKKKIGNICFALSIGSGICFVASGVLTVSVGVASAIAAPFLSEKQVLSLSDFSSATTTTGIASLFSATLFGVVAYRVEDDETNPLLSDRTSAEVPQLRVNEPGMEVMQLRVEVPDWNVGLSSLSIHPECAKCKFCDSDSVGYFQNGCAVHPMGRISDNCLDFEQRPTQWFVVRVLGGNRKGIYLQDERGSYELCLSVQEPELRKAICDRLGVKSIYDAIGKSIELKSDTALDARFELERSL